VDFQEGMCEGKRLCERQRPSDFQLGGKRCRRQNIADAAGGGSVRLLEAR
jgi:hypothetical protein